MVLPSNLEVISATVYRGVARDLVAKLKYSSRIAVICVAAELLANALEGRTWSRIVCVPAAPARQRARGFDSAHLLARHLAARTGGVSPSNCLVRRDGPRQVGRSRAERLAGAPQVHVRTGRRPPPGQILLVDDVLTTGATLRACAQALREGGAERIWAATFAAA